MMINIDTWQFKEKPKFREIPHIRERMWEQKLTVCIGKERFLCRKSY